MGKYGVVYADPPWHYEAWGKDSPRAPAAHYTVQDTDWLMGLPIAAVCEENCALFLWATWPKLACAMRVIEAWGFEYKTCGFDWVKVNRDGSPKWGLGYYTRANSEPCLLATRGRVQRVSMGVHQVVVSGTGEHSEKPAVVYERIEALLPGPYLELFHRPRDGMFPPREGWTFLGDAVDGMDMEAALREEASARR